MLNPDYPLPPPKRHTYESLKAENKALKEHIKLLAKRIHNQRVALRENWEIVEMRANYQRRKPIRDRLLAACLKYRKKLNELGVGPM